MTANAVNGVWLDTCVHPEDHHAARVRKVGRLFGDELDFEDMKFPVKIKDIHKIEKNNYIDISVFGYENKVLNIQ